MGHPEFCCEKGKAKPLAFNEGFKQLVQRYGINIPPKAILDELLRLSLVEAVSEHEFQLVENAFIPYEDE